MTTPSPTRQVVLRPTREVYADNAHICVTNGDSFRLAQATAGKGVTPLAT